LFSPGGRFNESISLIEMNPPWTMDLRGSRTLFPKLWKRLVCNFFIYIHRFIKSLPDATTHICNKLVPITEIFFVVVVVSQRQKRIGVFVSLFACWRLSGGDNLITRIPNPPP
jgi:hypothetical protein